MSYVRFLPDIHSLTRKRESVARDQSAEIRGVSSVVSRLDIKKVVDGGAIHLPVVNYAGLIGMITDMRMGSIKEDYGSHRQSL